MDDDKTNYYKTIETPNINTSQSRPIRKIGLVRRGSGGPSPFG